MNVMNLNREESPGMERDKKKLARKIVLLVVTAALILAWLAMTPPGLLGKSDAVAYAICHRIPSHSFYFGERPFSLCARCSGEYLGFLWGFLFLIVVARRRYEFPSLRVMIPLGGLFLFFVLDGLNSFIHFNPGWEKIALYTPRNSLRLFSGLGMGVLISIILYPLVGQTLFKEQKGEVILTRISEWAGLLGGAGVIGLLVLAENPLLSYPLILLSTTGLMALLTILYTVIWILVLKHEGEFRSWKDLSWWMLGGFVSALTQIALVDLMRYLITGSWSGFLGV